MRGETLRGMTNVSPLAEMKLYNQTSEQIFNKYFPDAENIQKGNSNLIIDPVDTDREGFTFEQYDFFFDSNKNGIQEGFEKSAFKLLLFVSTDGNKVQECYEVVKPAEDEIILFLETDHDILSSDVLYGRISEKIRKLYIDPDTEKLYKSFFEGDFMDVVKRYYSTDKDTIEQLLTKGFIENKSFSSFIFEGIKYVLLMSSAPAKAMGWVLKKIGGGADYLKIPDKFWDTESSDYLFDKENLIKNLSISDKALEDLKNIFTDRQGFDLSDIIPEVLDDIILKQIAVMESFTGKYNSYVESRIKDILNASENPQNDNEIAEDIAKAVALLCGLWNGLVDFVASTLKFAGSLLEAPFDIAEDFQKTLETIDNFCSMLSSKALWSNLEKAAEEGIKNMEQYLKSKNAGDINWVRVYYISGFTVSFVATLFIPIADALNALAKAGEVGEILAKVNEGISKAASEIANLARKTKEGIWKALMELFEMFAEGGEKLKEFVEKLWKAIADWFLKNKKLVSLVDEVDDIIKPLIKILKKNPAYVKAIELILGKQGRHLGQWLAIESEAVIKLYTGNIYIRLNKALRGVVKLDRELKAVQKVLDNALEKLPNFKQGSEALQRSVYFTEKEINKMFKVGKDFTEKGFMSTTHNESVLSQWLMDNPTHNVIYKVFGKNCKLIEKASMLPENEVLFKSGTTFTVESVNMGARHPLDQSKKIVEIILKEK